MIGGINSWEKGGMSGMTDGMLAEDRGRLAGVRGWCESRTGLLLAQVSPMLPFKTRAALSANASVFGSYLGSD